MTHLLHSTHPLSDIGARYKQYRAGEITLDEYVAGIEEDLCSTPRCLRPAVEVDRGRRFCNVCALRERMKRR